MNNALSDWNLHHPRLHGLYSTFMDIRFLRTSSEAIYVHKRLSLNSSHQNSIGDRKTIPSQNTTEEGKTTSVRTTSVDEETENVNTT